MKPARRGTQRRTQCWKPLGAREAQNLPGGWGIVADDVMAGIFGAVILQAALWWGPLG